MSDACINIRGNADDPGFVNAIKEVTGQALPTEPNTAARGAHCVYWLGPDEWLVTTAQENRAELLPKLDAALSSMHAAVNDLSGGNVAISLRGSEVAEVLAKGCTLDLERFAVGACAQTGLGKAGILLDRAAEIEYTIIVRRSFSDYLMQWLRHAGQDHDIEFG
ncbi:MAG: sarcosine oxidase subunit gamma family protein [Pseudomonadota bacterium]